MNEFNPGDTGIKWWNFSRPQDEDYNLTVTGTVLAIQKYQTTDRTTKMPDFWPEGDPKWRIRILFADFVGDPFIVGVTRSTKRNKEGAGKLHIDLAAIAGDNFTDLVGKTLSITTQEGQYGMSNARPFKVELQSGMGPFKPQFEIPAEWKEDIHMAPVPRTMPGMGVPNSYQQAPTQTYRMPQVQPQQPYQAPQAPPVAPPQQVPQGYQGQPQAPQQPPQGGYQQLDDGTPIDPNTGKPIY